MPSKFADQIYGTRAWRNCRKAYLKSVGGLCERCLKDGIIRAATDVHHKIRLTKENARDASIALNWDNLEALCAEHHKAEHNKTKRFKVDAMGHVIPTEE